MWLRILLFANTQPQARVIHRSAEYMFDEPTVTLPHIYALGSVLPSVLEAEYHTASYFVAYLLSIC